MKILNRRESISFAEKNHKKHFKTKKLHENLLIINRDMAKNVKNDHILSENRLFVLAWMLDSLQPPRFAIFFLLPIPPSDL